MTEKTLKDLFLAQLKDIYFAEKQIYKTLPQNGEGDGRKPLRRIVNRRTGTSSGSKRSLK